jgi:hypothetical protein
MPLGPARQPSSVICQSSTVTCPLFPSSPHHILLYRPCPSHITGFWSNDVDGCPAPCVARRSSMLIAALDPGEPAAKQASDRVIFIRPALCTACSISGLPTARVQCSQSPAWQRLRPPVGELVSRVHIVVPNQAGVSLFLEAGRVL